MRSWTFLLVVGLAVVFASPADARRKRKRPKPRPRVEKVEPAEKKDEAQPTEDGEEKKTTVAVLSLDGLGISPAMLKNLEMLLRNSIATIESCELIPPVDIQMALQDPKNQEVATCGGGNQCAAQVGALVDADQVVFGSIGALGAAFSLDLRAVDVETGRQIAKQRTSISGNRDLLIPEIRLAAFKLIAPDRIRGSLQIEIDVEGVEVEIDGKVIGTTPIKEPVNNLAPGSHVVVVKRPGYSQFQREFEIRAFETAHLQLELKTAEEKRK